MSCFLYFKSLTDVTSIKADACHLITVFTISSGSAPELYRMHVEIKDVGGLLAMRILRSEHYMLYILGYQLHGPSTAIYLIIYAFHVPSKGQLDDLVSIYCSKSHKISFRMQSDIWFIHTSSWRYSMETIRKQWQINTLIFECNHIAEMAVNGYLLECSPEINVQKYSVFNLNFQT